VLIQQWINDYGIQSDVCRARILGLPPSASELQYIPKSLIEEARQRKQVAGSGHMVPHKGREVV
jgi:hypothetical protein